MAITDFSPRDTLEYTLKRWWGIVACMVLGGIIGGLFFLVRPPVYEASFIFALNIDQTQTGPLTEIELDQTLWSGSELLNTPWVRTTVAEAAQKEGITVDSETLQEISTLERQQAKWRLTIRHEDPQVAFTLASIWGEAAWAALTESHASALQTQALQAYLLTLGECLPYPAPQREDCPLPWTRVDLPAAQATAAAAVEESAQTSHGVIPALVFTYTDQPTSPTEPVARGRNTLVFAGMVAGFWVSLGLVNLRRKSGHDT